jgi:hypothetical protein
MECKLCHKNKKLCRSHIIPEFFYENMYSDKHTYREVSFKKEKMKFPQKGYREFLLCQNCETFLSRYEKYASSIYKDKFLNLDTSEKYFEPNDIDYKKFKIFELTILWRCGISKGDYFSINLGPHEEKIRQMLINENPGKVNNYGCIIFAILGDGNKLLRGVQFGQSSSRLEGHHVYKILFGGFLWIFFVSSHNISSKFNKMFLKENGSIIIPINHYSKHKYLNQMAGRVQDLRVNLKNKQNDL